MPIELGSFALGTVVGGVVVQYANHLLAKSRDKESREAKDFNAAADALDEVLAKERTSPVPGAEIDFYPFRRVLKGQDLTRFNQCVEEYERTVHDAEIYFQEYAGSIVLGSGRYKDTKLVIAAIDKLLEFTKRK